MRVEVAPVLSQRLQLGDHSTSPRRLVASVAATHSGAVPAAEATAASVVAPASASIESELQGDVSGRGAPAAVTDHNGARMTRDAIASLQHETQVTARHDVTADDFPMPMLRIPAPGLLTLARQMRSALQAALRG